MAVATAEARVADRSDPPACLAGSGGAEPQAAHWFARDSRATQQIFLAVVGVMSSKNLNSWLCESLALGWNENVKRAKGDESQTTQLVTVF